MPQDWVIENVNLSLLKRLAQLVSLFIRPGDWLLLEGELGAGKTAFARFLIEELLGAENHQDIPSPTFSLVQTYDAPRMQIKHFDFYRLRGSDEALELGLEDDADSLKLIEWPDRAKEFLPEDRLQILFEDNSADDVSCADDERRITISGSGVWGKRLSRLEALDGFLQDSGWAETDVSYLQGDASARSYARFHNGVRKAVLMDSPKAPDGPPVVDGKSYSEIAHLAEDVSSFVAIAQELTRAGISVPHIRAHDLEQGFLIIDDFGSRVFGNEIAAGRDMEPLWCAGVDVLLELRRSPPPSELPLPGGGCHRLSTYDEQALMIEAALLPDWYWRWAKGEVIPQEARSDFTSRWSPITQILAQEAAGWVLRDFHSPNLMWLDGAEGLQRVGVLDFQDAVIGHPAYDLVSLLQDARLDVPDETENVLLDYYCNACAQAEGDFNEALFRARYAMLGAQRNTKILGIFTRLAERDNKQGYLVHLPRIWRYLRKNLAHPELENLRLWYEEHFRQELLG